ncbi:hypothetical protein [Reinekea sp.]|jgi:hypothetical protein|uniref:hypothetical protein n=1 Tax=Reinekea sp. TaxID=1970455 RepID=UPI003989CAB7
MKLSTLFLAITTVSLSTAQASSFLAQDPVEAVADKNTAFDNPAYLAQTANQITFADSDNIGYVFNAFGQKMAVHVGAEPSLYAPNTALGTNPDSYTLNNDRMGLDNFKTIDDQIDLFWVGNMSFGSLGVRASAGSNGSSGQWTADFLNNGAPTFNGADGTAINAQADGTYNSYALPSSGSTSLVTGTVTDSLSVSKNEKQVKAGFYSLTAGVQLNDLPLDATFSLNLPSYSTSSSFSYVESQTDTAGPTTLDKITADYSESVGKTGGLSISTTGRYKLEDTLHVTSGLMIHNETVSAEYDVSFTEVNDTDTSTAALDSNETWTYKESQLSESSTFAMMAGLDYQTVANNVIFRAQPSLLFVKNKTESSEKVGSDTYVDALDANNNVTDPTGTNNSSFVQSNTTISLPVNLSVEYAASERWTWRGGASAAILTHTKEEQTETVYKVDVAGTGYEKDYETKTQEDLNLLIGSSVAMNLGFTYAPLPNITLDSAINTSGALQNWRADFGLTYKY